MKVGMRLKVITLFLLAGIIPFIVMALMAYNSASRSLRNQAFNHLVSAREIKKHQIEDYFSTIKKQIRTFSEDRMIVEATMWFKDAFSLFQIENDISPSELKEYRAALKNHYAVDFTEEYKRHNNGRTPDAMSFFNQLDNESIALQYFYISANHHPLGEKHKLNAAEGFAPYNNFHKIYHPAIRDYLEQFGYYDIFIVDPNTGDIVYSVFKELDFTTSLIDGPYAKTNLGKVFREANNSNDPNYIKLIDFEPYAPSYENTTSFIASPIFDGSEKVGILIFQMPIDNINKVMTSNSNWANVGFGETGETYLIGNDFTMRSLSRFIIEDEKDYYTLMDSVGMDKETLDKIKIKESTIGLQKIETMGTSDAVKGQTDIKVFPGYRGIPVLSAYTPLNIEDVKWVIMSEIEEEEALLPVIKLRSRLFIVGIVTIFIIVAIAFYFSSTITKPILKVVGMVKKISEGNLTKRLKVESRDEIGELASQFNNFVDKVHEIISMVKSTTAEVSSSSSEISAAVEEQAAVTSQQSSAVMEITSTMEELSTSSTQIADNSGSVVKISNEALDNSKTGATAIEDINEKMKLISQDNQQNIDQIVELGRKSKEITKVMEIINNIADQTKLIAFNAAIEASSAGEAGTRFGVVAVEIRRLADNVMESTDEIQSKIEDIQDAVNRLVITSEKGSKRVNEGMDLAVQTVDILHNILSGAQSTTDSSEQISLSTQQQKSASNQVVTSLKEITEGAKQISAAVKETRTSTNNLTKLSHDLKNLIDWFKLNEKLEAN